MKAILVTQTLKDLNPHFFKNIAVGVIAPKDIPSTFVREDGQVLGYEVREDLQALDGWKDIVIPPINTETQYRSNNLVLDVDLDVYTYDVINYTTEELQFITIEKAESARQTKLQQEQVKVVEEKFQAIEDDSQVIENKDAYPLWRSKPDGFEFTANYKVQDFDENNELQVFRIITPHAKQFDRVPNTTPALWSKILIGAGGVEIWTQPIGGDGKYPLINPLTTETYEVLHNNETWRNRRTLNTSEPGTVSSGWMQVSNTPAPWYFLGNEGYPINWTVTHNGSIWESSIDNNFWEPGVSSWTNIGVAP